MTRLDPNRVLDSTAQGLAADARSLDSLKRQAARDPQAALKNASQQFEALFLQMVLKSMRDAVPKSGLLDSDSQQTYTSMLDQQLSTKISQSGTGLASVIAKQLGRYMTNGKAAPAAGAPGANTAAAAPSAAVNTLQPGAIARAGADATVTPAAALAARSSVAPPARAALDRYAEIAGVNPNSALRQTADAARDTNDARLGYAQRTFVNRMWDHAVAAQQATGIPAKFVLGQAALESGWGQREIKDSVGLPTYNLFGMKAGNGWQGRTVDVVTTEYENGVAKQVTEKFRAYNNYSEAFRDWAQLIAGNKRYAQVVQSGRAGDSAAGYADGLARAGYATDPQYGAKLARVIGSLASVRSSAG
jgi:flagellar protein FlgJ